MTALQNQGTISATGIVDMAVDDAQVDSALTSDTRSCKDAIVAAVKRARYNNLYSLLRDNVAEHEYLQIVRNQILVDIQGGDILYQIFTQCVLQRNAGEEAPFLEFIQRVCADCRNVSKFELCKPVKPGCGGFGIRNFLTLFLSIEVSKAMRDADDFAAAGDDKKAGVSRQIVELLTEQLDLSNPILTRISDAMTEEHDLGEELKANPGDEAKKAAIEAACKIKTDGNAALQKLSMEFATRMKELKSTL